MKLLNENSVPEVKSRGVEQVTDFTINVTAQAFSILSSGLYKDPIKAIIRELSTNAIDSHTEAGTSDKPFDVEFPTKFAPLFRIRDYGTGLSKEDVLGLYSSYFSSTKTGSNDQIGALGLGSKSPLGYTNSFTVVSYFNNVKTNFSIFIGDNGFPNIAVTGETPCGIPMKKVEPTGLEIIIPVKEESYWMHKWYDNAKEIYKYFDNVPNIMGAEIDIKKPDYSRTVGKIKVHNDATRSNVIQGNIAYPLDMSSIDISDEGIVLINNVSFDVYVDIGEVSFLPNREELSYDEKTKENIRKAIMVFVTDLKKDIKKSIKKIKTINGAFTTFDDIVHNYKTLIQNSPVLNEMLLKKMSRYEEFIKVTISSGYGFSGIHYKIQNIEKILKEKYDRVLYYREGKRTKIKHSTVSTGRDMIFWINDTGKSIINKFGKGVTNNDHNILIPVVEDPDVVVKFLKKTFKITNKQIRFVSEVDFPTITRRKLEGVRVNRMRRISYGTSRYSPKNWKWERGLKLDSVDQNNPDETFIWVEVKGYTTQNHLKNKGYSFADFLGNGRGETIWNLKSVYGIKSPDVADIKSRENWIHIDDYVKSNIKKYISEKITSDIAYTISELDDMISFSRKMDIDRIQNKEIKSIIKLLKDVSTSSDNVTTKIEQWTSSLGIENLSEIGIDFNDKTVYNDGHELNSFIEKKYIHLKLINDIGYYNVSDQVYNLINDLY